MYDLRIYEFLKNKGLHIVRLTSRHDETLIRCPFCGDSINQDSAHLYIKNEPPFKFYCQKCNTTGTFNNKMMTELGLYSNEFSKMLDEVYINYKTKINIKYGDSYNNYFKQTKELIYLPNQYDELEMKKIDYFESRMGFELFEEDISRFKIILNLNDFINNNELNIRDTKFLNEINYLNNSTFSFLLNDNNSLNNRFITGNSKYRYKNIKLFQEELGFSRKFYTIQNNVNLKRDTFKIILTEGAFDIISVYHNIYNRNMDDATIFAGVNGKSYPFTLNYIMKLGILNADVYIYSDKDVPISFYKKIKKYNILLKYNGVNIFYNKIGKDYGVKKEEIELSNMITL